MSNITQVPVLVIPNLHSDCGNIGSIYEACFCDVFSLPPREWKPSRIATNAVNLGARSTAYAWEWPAHLYGCLLSCLFNASRWCLPLHLLVFPVGTASFQAQHACDSCRTIIQKLGGSAVSTRQFMAKALRLCLFLSSDWSIMCANRMKLPLLNAIVFIACKVPVSVCACMC